MKNDFCIIIPSYNEARHLGGLLEKIAPLAPDTYVIDDGSLDHTAKVLKSFDVNVITHGKNIGKGRSLRDGFATTMKKKYDFFVTMDGDGQHDPSEINGLLDRIKRTGYDILYGNRMNNPEGMPLIRKFINRKASRMLSGICKVPIYDPLCGFRVIKRRVLENISLNCDGFNIVSEILIKAVKKGYSIGAMDIKCLYGDEVSHISPLKDYMQFVKMVREIEKDEKSSNNK